MTQTIRNKNGAGQYHGYQQSHRLNTIAFRGTYKNNSNIGYTEWHFGIIPTIIYFIQ